MAEKNSFMANDDGLLCPEVGSWTETKHDHVAYYAKLFSSGMKQKWDRRVYVELYAGAGFYRVRGSSKIIIGSPLRALLLPDRFDKYIFCEEDSDKLAALEKRAKRFAPNADVAFVAGDCNRNVTRILKEIPVGTKTDTVLTLCFADPYDIGLKFSTLRALSEGRLVDFVVLLALWSDANRAYKHYMMSDSVKVDEFLGSKTWRERWDAVQATVQFPKFLAEEFASMMETIGYLRTPSHKMKRFRSDEKNLPLYYIAMFSGHPLAHRFWDDVLKYGTDQKTFSWE
jgi:three-Cys-motif partner protein